jgi:hypothetical protein
VMINISAAAQGRRVIKYTSKNDPRPRRSAAKSKNFAKEGDSSDNDPTPYLFQAINNNKPGSSLHDHREKRASTINEPKNVNEAHHGQGRNPKNAAAPKIRDQTQYWRHGRDPPWRSTSGTACTNDDDTLPTTPSTKHPPLQSPKTYQQKGNYLRNAAAPKIRGQSQNDKETMRDPPRRELSGKYGDEEFKGCNEEE